MMRTSVRRQRGATLIITLIMLAVLTLFAVSAFNLSSVNLKITGNYQSQKSMEAAAQQAIEQLISQVTPFNLTPAASTVCVGGGIACLGGYNVAISAPACYYSTTAKGYTKKVGELTPEDTTWEIRASVTDSLTGAKATIVQGVAIRMLAGNCP